MPEDSGDERGRAAEREVNGEGGAVPQDQGASAVHQEGASETHQVTMHICTLHDCCRSTPDTYHNVLIHVSSAVIHSS